MNFLLLAVFVFAVVMTAVKGAVVCLRLKLGIWEGMKSSAIANAASTIIAVPIGSIIHFLTGMGAMELMFYSHDHWHMSLPKRLSFLGDEICYITMPVNGGSVLDSSRYFAAGIAWWAVACCAMSYLLEQEIWRRSLGRLDGRDVKRAVLCSNMIVYELLYLVALAGIVIPLANNGAFRMPW